MAINTPLITWEKWVDPMGFDSDEDYLNDNLDEDNPIIKTKPIKMIVTPMGMVPFNENTASSSIFNFWVGHCNFDISCNVSNIIEQIPGVETLDIFTRYRFRIAVGKAFDDGEVMRNINHNIYRHFNYDKLSTDK
jgi:hypothetical protein